MPLESVWSSVIAPFCFLGTLVETCLFSPEKQCSRNSCIVPMLVQSLLIFFSRIFHDISREVADFFFSKHIL